MENSKIEWTHHTFNPVIGCQKVSDGCKFCYAEELMDHRYGKVKWGASSTRQRTSAANWRKPLRWDKDAQAQGIRYRVFCASLSDVFEDHPGWVQPRADLFGLIDRTPNLDWLLLTKRPEGWEDRLHEVVQNNHDGGDMLASAWLDGEAPRNIWLGTSVENQEAADKRIPELLKIPAAVRFLSCEPLLGPVALDDEWLWTEYYVPSSQLENWADDGSRYKQNIHWTIVGGESGAKARPMQTEWALDLRRQCQAAAVPYFMKQLGGHPDKRHELADFPPELQCREFPEVSA